MMIEPLMIPTTAETPNTAMIKSQLKALDQVASDKMDINNT